MEQISILNSKIDDKGYVSIFTNCWIKQHRYVVEKFIGRELTSTETIHHLNGIKSDNRVENLEWCTQKENIQHALKTGLTPSNYSKIKRA